MKHEQRSAWFRAWEPQRWTSAPLASDVSLPRVTVGVLCYNRRDDLRRTLDVLTRAVFYPDLEIIVVDNASTDGTDAMLAAEFPTIRVIRMSENLNVAARNEFYRAATGTYVFSYDDDSFPATPVTIIEAVRLMESRPEVGAASFFCYQPRSDFAETGGLEHFHFSGDGTHGFEGLYFVEGGMCMRKTAFDAIDGYDPEFRWGAEGADLTLQLYRRGIPTIYYPLLATIHMRSDIHRSDVHNIRLFTRNYLWTIAKHFPLYAAIPLTCLYIARKIVGMAMHPALSTGFVGGIASGLAGFLRQRRKASKLSLRQVLHLGRWYLFLLRW